MQRVYLTSLVLSLMMMACTLEQENRQAYKKNKILFSDLNDLHRPMPPPRPGDWRTLITEKGQSFETYIHTNPNKADHHRNKIYLLPLGYLSQEEHMMIQALKDYLHDFYTLETEVLEQSIIVVPKQYKGIVTDRLGRRTQIYAPYILRNNLEPSLPDDAAVYLAITNDDLYASDQGGSVFSISNKKRVAIVSLALLKEHGSRATLARLLKMASHEIGHVFGLTHCVDYQCNMNGRNNVQEIDRYPAYLGPDCLEKLSWNRQFDIKERYESLADFFMKHNFEEEYSFCKKSIEYLTPQ